MSDLIGWASELNDIASDMKRHGWRGIAESVMAVEQEIGEILARLAEEERKRAEPATSDGNISAEDRG
jgi:hypothetical protein